MANVSATYCLLCAGLNPLTEVIDVENKIEEIINKLTRINATAYFHCVNLPKVVCTKCMIMLEGSYDFVLAVERAQPALLDLNRKIKQEICDNFEAIEICDNFETIQTVIEIKIEQGIENVGEGENPLKYEVEPPASTIDTPVDTLISTATVKKENETVQTNTKQKCIKKKCQPPLINPPSTWEDYIWKCGFCDTEFPTHEELKTHAMEFHQCCNIQKCYDCNVHRGNLNQFIKHVQQQHRKHLRYSCHLCFKILPTAHKAGKHRHTHRQTPHSCKGCNTTFETEIQLKDHMSTYYRNLYDKTASKTDVKTDDVTCKTCDKTFENHIALRQHMRVHMNRKRDYTCETCGKCFLNKHGLAGHMAVHTDERPFPCTICPQRFKRSNHLLNHLETHSAENLYTCDVCDRSFKLKKNLETHRIVHTNLFPYVCSYCNRRFRFKNTLNQHESIHTGVMRYTCSVCQRQFRIWPNYNKHMKSQHNMNMSKRNLNAKNHELTESEKEHVETVLREREEKKKRRSCRK